MSDDDYLWDRSGPPDPEVVRLEELLGTLRSDRPSPRMTPAPARVRHNPYGGILPSLLAAAACFLAVAGTWWRAGGPAPSWEFTLLEAGGAGASERRLRVGQWLETDGSSRARLKIGRIGQVDVEPRTRVRLVDAGDEAHRLSLARGTLHARIWAPPGSFFVNTPSAVAVDLGCAYTLEVDDAGAGLLTVASGWVGFEFHGRESFVPRGALCRTRPGFGPGTPYYGDASASFRHALTRVDFGEGEGGRAEALRIVLEDARPRDAFSLWHLLARLSGAERAAVYDRMAALVPPPPGVTRSGILQGDRAMRDRWWDALDLQSAGWWRLWKAPWPPQGR